MTLCADPATCFTFTHFLKRKHQNNMKVLKRKFSYKLTFTESLSQGSEHRDLGRSTSYPFDTILLVSLELSTPQITSENKHIERKLSGMRFCHFCNIARKLMHLNLYLTHSSSNFHSIFQLSEKILD